MESLDASLSSIFYPYVSTHYEGEWGHCHEEQRQEFLVGFEKFCSDLSEAIKSLNGGIELRKLDQK